MAVQIFLKKEFQKYIGCIFGSNLWQESINGGEVTTGDTFIITRQYMDAPFELQTTQEIISEDSAENKKGYPCTASDSYTVSPSL